VGVGYLKVKYGHFSEEITEIQVELLECKCGAVLLH